MRKTIFANDEYYHIYNRGVDKRDVFNDEKDFKRFLIGMKEFNRVDAIGSLYEKYLREKRANGGSTSMIKVKPLFLGKPLVEIVAFCLNPNHYHLIVKQIADKGVEKFMQKLGTSYTMYFNGKYKRSGSLFQGRFKSIHIDSNEYLLHLSAYVNKNYFIHGGSEKIWLYSSELDYVGKRNGTLCYKNSVLDQFGNSFVEYEKFLNKSEDYFKERKELEKYVLE